MSLQQVQQLIDDQEDASRPALPKLFFCDPVIFILLLRDPLKMLSPVLAYR